MGKLESFAIEGLRLWFNSQDHLPPHFHVGRVGDWEIRVFFLLCTPREFCYDVKWGLGPSRAERQDILSASLCCREALLIEWSEKVCQQSRMSAEWI